MKHFCLIFATTLIMSCNISYLSPKPIESWQKILNKNVVRQQFDLSCGAGAMATLLNYFFQDEISEKEILTDIVKNLTPEKLKNREKNGLTMLDLKQFAVRRGYNVQGLKLKLSDLKLLKGPVIVVFDTFEGDHYAVLRGIREDRIFLADPARGNIRLPVWKFSEVWSGIILALSKKGFALPSSHLLSLPRDSTRNELDVAREFLY